MTDLWAYRGGDGGLVCGFFGGARNVLVSSKIVLGYFAKNVKAIVKDFGAISSR